MKGELPKFGSRSDGLGWDAAEYAADCHFVGALSKASPFLGVLFREKGVKKRCHGLFIASASCFCLVVTRAQS